MKITEISEHHTGTKRLLDHHDGRIMPVVGPQRIEHILLNTTGTVKTW